MTLTDFMFCNKTFWTQTEHYIFLFSDTATQNCNPVLFHWYFVFSYIVVKGLHCIIILNKWRQCMPCSSTNHFRSSVTTEWEHTCFVLHYFVFYRVWFVGVVREGSGDFWGEGAFFMYLCLGILVLSILQNVLTSTPVF